MDERGVIERQMALAQALRGMGDPRYGGALPPGGKEAMMGGGGKSAAAAYDALANMREAELEDLQRRAGAFPQSTIQRSFDPAR